MGGKYSRSRSDEKKRTGIYVFMAVLAVAVVVAVILVWFF